MVEPTQFSMFKTVFYYSIFIILAPISTFFSVKFLIEGSLGTSNVTSNVCSAVAAVIVLHIALGLYIYRAYSDSSKIRTEKDDKID